MQAELTGYAALAVEAKPEGICPGCAGEMEKRAGVVWGTLLLIAIFPLFGFLAFLMTGLVEKRAVCPSCGHSGHLYKVF